MVDGGKTMQTLSNRLSWLTKLEQHIVTINQKQATGELIIGHKTAQWRLYFFLGQLLYAVEETHRVRRWQRSLKKYCPRWLGQHHQLTTSELWECQLLHRGMAQGDLTAAEVKAVVRETTQEVLFSMIQQENLVWQWRNRQYQELGIPFYLTLCPMEIQQLFEQSQHLHHQWQEMGVQYLHPELVPAFKQSPSELTQCSADTFLNLTAFFNGRYTIWDISLKMKQPLTRIVRLVHHFYQQGAVELQEVADLPLPITIEPVNKPKNNLPAIACVDDSPLIGRYLEEILAPAGYRVIYIQDPIQALTTLTEEKPLLIFLDLVMPKTDGYNVCNFLRKSEACSKTPVIMLTSSNGLINRARAKLAGADDFLTKPFDSEQILQVVHKYLGAAVPGR